MQKLVLKNFERKWFRNQIYGSPCNKKYTLKYGKFHNADVKKTFYTPFTFYLLDLKKQVCEG